MGGEQGEELLGPSWFSMMEEHPGDGSKAWGRARIAAGRKTSSSSSFLFLFFFLIFSEEKPWKPPRTDAHVRRQMEGERMHTYSDTYSYTYPYVRPRMHTLEGWDGEWQLPNIHGPSFLPLFPFSLSPSPPFSRIPCSSACKHASLKAMDSCAGEGFCRTDLGVTARESER
jgi:hypothetical protein